jgi:hypothetical protein
MKFLYALAAVCIVIVVSLVLPICRGYIGSDEFGELHKPKSEYRYLIECGSQWTSHVKEMYADSYTATPATGGFQLEIERDGMMARPICSTFKIVNGGLEK